jgi:hypothetical protein
MSIFSQAVNGFRSTASRAGKFYNSPGARRAVRMSKHMAASSVAGNGKYVMGAAAAVGAAGGAATDRDSRMSGAIRGAIGGAAIGGAVNLGRNPAIQRMARNQGLKAASWGLNKSAAGLMKTSDYLGI